MMLTAIQKIVENYIDNRAMTDLLIGTYTKGRVVINSKAYIPQAILAGNLKDSLQEGDKVRVLRNDGGGEYYVMEIIGAPVMLKREVPDEGI